MADQFTGTDNFGASKDQPESEPLDENGHPVPTPDAPSEPSPSDEPTPEDDGETTPDTPEAEPETPQE